MTKANEELDILWFKAMSRSIAENFARYRSAILVAAEKDKEIERLREAVKAEREACARLCERLPETFKIAADEFGYKAEAPTAENYAAAIRTRSDT